MWRRAGAVATAMVLLGAGCGGDDAAPTTAAPAAGSTATAPATRPAGSAAASPATAATAGPGTGGSIGTAVAAVPPALEFAAATLGGGQFDGRAYAGSNLALWFWAPY